MYYLHRELLGLEHGDGLQCDHVDRDKLNCRRKNLRIVTHAQNGQNVLQARGSSRYRGVTWRKEACKWQAQCQVEGKHYNLGSYDTEVEAAEVAAAFRAEHLPFSEDATKAKAA